MEKQAEGAVCRRSSPALLGLQLGGMCAEMRDEPSSEQTQVEECVEGGEDVLRAMGIEEHNKTGRVVRVEPGMLLMLL